MMSKRTTLEEDDKIFYCTVYSVDQIRVCKEGDRKSAIFNREEYINGKFNLNDKGSIYGHADLKHLQLMNNSDDLEITHNQFYTYILTGIMVEAKDE